MVVVLSSKCLAQDFMGQFPREELRTTQHLEMRCSIKRKIYCTARLNSRELKRQY